MMCLCAHLVDGSTKMYDSILLIPFAYTVKSYQIISRHQVDTRSQQLPKPCLIMPWSLGSRDAGAMVIQVQRHGKWVGCHQIQGRIED